MSSTISPTVTPTATTPQTPRVRRKPVPKVEYAVRYPQPDPNDPLAPLSALRSRHPDGAIFSAIPPFSPSTTIPEPPSTIMVPDPTLACEQQEPIAGDPQPRRFTMHRRSASAQGLQSVNAMSGPISAPAFDRPPSQLQRQKTPSDALVGTTPESKNTVVKRRRTRSIGASSSAAQVPPLPTNLAATLPKHRAPPLLDSRPTSRDSESSHASSHFVSSHLADFRDYPLHLLHTVASDSGAAEPPDTRRTTMYNKTMRVMAVDTPSQHMMREASEDSVAAELAVARRSTVRKKASRLSLFTRSRPSTPVHALAPSLPPPISQPRPSASSEDSDTSYTTAESTPTPPTSASSVPSSRACSPPGRGRTLTRESAVAPSADECSASEEAAKPSQKHRRSRTLSRISRTLHHKSSSPAPLKAKISNPLTPPVPIPLVSTKAAWAPVTPQSVQPEPVTTTSASALAPARMPAVAQEDGSLPASGTPVSPRTPRTDMLAHPPIAMTRSKTAHHPAPLRPKRSHLRSVSDPHALSTAMKSAFPDAKPVPPVPARTRALPPPPPPRFEQPSVSEPLSAFSRPPTPPPALYSPAQVPYSAPIQQRSSSGSPRRPPLPRLAPLASPAPRPTPRMGSPITPPRSSPSRRRFGSTYDVDGQRSPVGRRPAGMRSQSALPYAPRRDQALAHEHPVPIAGLGALPSIERLERAAQMIVLKENGLPVVFGDLWETQRTVVLFIRHFWCPSCQEYLATLMHEVDHAALQSSGVQLIVIGCGPFNLIKSYRHIFHLPYQVFVDASRDQQLYHTLGMSALLPSHTPAPARDKSEYAKAGSVRGMAMVWKNALRTGMPFWAKGGDTAQLGGEFVLGPGLTCTYAHRMQHVRGHAPILDVLRASGVDVARKTRVRLPRGSSESSSSSSSSAGTSSESEREREEILKRMAGISIGKPAPIHSNVVVPSLSRQSIGWESTESSVFVNAD